MQLNLGLRWGTANNGRVVSRQGRLVERPTKASTVLPEFLSVISKMNESINTLYVILCPLACLPLFLREGVLGTLSLRSQKESKFDRAMQGINPMRGVMDCMHITQCCAGRPQAHQAEFLPFGENNAGGNAGRVVCFCPLCSNGPTILYSTLSHDRVCMRDTIRALRSWDLITVASG